MIVDIIFVALVIVLILAIYKLKFKNDTTKIANTTINDIARQGHHQPQQANQRQQIQQPARPRWAQAEPQAEQLSSDSQVDEKEGRSMTSQDRKKQLRKQEKAKQRQQRKQAMEHFLEQEKQKREKKQEEEQQKERLEQQKKKKEDEYYRMLAEQQEKKKKAEYDKWKGLFKVEDEGKAKQSAEVELQKKQQLLTNILKSLKKSKLSLLEDLAHKFKLSTAEIIEKIKQLQSREQVKGIFDERGKYLVVEQKEWDAIRNYIEARGRLKKTDIMQECARIIKIPENIDVDEEVFGLIEKENEGQSV